MTLVILKKSKKLTCGVNLHIGPGRRFGTAELSFSTEELTKKDIVATIKVRNYGKFQNTSVRVFQIMVIGKVYLGTN